MKDFDKNASYFSIGCWFVFSGLMALPFPIVALTTGDEDALPMIGVGCGMVLFIPVLGLAFQMLIGASKRSPEIVKYLEDIRAHIGGEVVLPSAFFAFIQPRVVSTISGVEVEVRLLPRRGRGAASFMLTRWAEEEHAQFRPHWLGTKWSVYITSATPTPFTVGAATRTKLSSAAIGIGGATEIPSGDANYDRVIALATKEPHIGSAVFADAIIRGRFTQLLRANAPLVTNVSYGPAGKLRAGGIWTAMIGEQLTADRVVWIARELCALGQELQRRG